MLRRALYICLITITALVLEALGPDIAHGQVQKQYGRVTCPAATSGGIPTSVTVSREATSSGVWSVVTPAPLPLSGTPLSSAPFIDLTRFPNTSYRYRCDYINASGTVSSDPVPLTGQVFLDLPVIPGKGTAIFDVITQ